MSEQERAFRQERMELKHAVYSKAKGRGMTMAETTAVMRQADALLREKQAKVARGE